MATNATNRPVSDRIVRERTFEVLRKRPDGQDARAQLIITVDDVLKANFTGQLILNCNGGFVSSIQVRESQKLE